MLIGVFEVLPDGVVSPLGGVVCSELVESFVLVGVFRSVCLCPLRMVGDPALFQVEREDHPG